MVSVVFTNPPKLQIQSINTVICTLLACEIGFPRKIDLIYNVDMTARGSLFLLPDYCLNYSHDIDMRYKVWRNHHKVLKAFAATTIDEKIITYCRFIGIDYNRNSYTKKTTYILDNIIILILIGIIEVHTGYFKMICTKGKLKYNYSSWCRIPKTNNKNFYFIVDVNMIFPNDKCVWW